jgi:hypothetical protein
MRVFLFFLLFTSYHFASAQAGTDIWVFKVEKKDGKPVLKSGKNVTERKGYDNQPVFSEDGDLLYFSSDRDTSKKIHVFQHYKGDCCVLQTTNTQTSEYSPAIMPNHNLSVLMVEKDSSQHIWEFDLKHARWPKRRFSFRDSIGYYAWVDRHSALAFILGGKNANRIELINDDKEARTILTGVGRGMQVFKNNALILKQNVDTTFTIHVTDYKTSRELIRTPGKSQDMTVWGDYLLMADGSTLYAAEMIMSKGNLEALKPFEPVADLSSSGAKKITRLAVSHNEKWIAVVAADQ